MKKPLIEIRIISIMIALYPLFALAQYSLFSEEKASFSLLFWLAWLLLFCHLGYGVYKLDQRRRVAVLILFTVFMVAPMITVLIAMIVTSLLNADLLRGAIEMHGLDTVVWMPLINLMYAFIPNILYWAFVIYKLTRPNIKECFQK